MVATGRITRNRHRRFPTNSAADLLIDGMPGHGGEFPDQTVGNPAAARHIVIAFESGDRGARRIVQRSGRFDLTVAIFREHPLYSGDARRWADQLGNCIIAMCGGGLRQGRVCDRTRWTAAERFERVAFCA
jgi:hypothetical protein